jgi:ABC-2 type transport system permease protein
MFGLLAIPAGLYAATRIATMSTDETNRRWTPLLASRSAAPASPPPR